MSNQEQTQDMHKQKQTITCDEKTRKDTDISDVTN